MERRSESEAAAELYRGVEELISGQLDSLMLEPGSSVSVPANDGPAGISPYMPGVARYSGEEKKSS